MLRAFHLTTADADRFVAQIEEFSRIVIPADIPDIPMRDETDRPVVGTAVAGKADILCTCDNDLFQGDIVGFCAGRGIRILSDRALLRHAHFRI